MLKQLSRSNRFHLPSCGKSSGSGYPFLGDQDRFQWTLCSEEIKVEQVGPNEYIVCEGDLRMYNHQYELADLLECVARRMFPLQPI